MTVSIPVRLQRSHSDGDGFVWRPDCRHFVGGLPCRHWRPCAGCNEYDRVDARVLIVMLGLLGDMLIASPLPARIKRHNPATHITWLVDEACAPVLRMNPDIDRVLPYDWHSATQLLSETFSAVYSFERTPSAASLVDRITAEHKAGLAWGGPHNGLYPIGTAAEQFFRMNLWNDYRAHRNTTTWTELYFAVAGYRYDAEPYVLRVPEPADARARALVDGMNPTVCLNVGGSLATKIWPAAHWLALGSALLEHGFQLVITGGPADTAMCESLHRGLTLLARASDRVRYLPLTIEEFAAVPAYCLAVVTGDTFGFHLALAHRRPTVLLLGPSSGAEVIPKHVTNVTALRSTLACSPCAHQVTCGGSGGCMDTISPADAFTALASLLDAAAPGACATDPTSISPGRSSE